MARGIVLRVPRGQAVRPATDQLREAVFSRLAGAVEGARCLDLFAGTGSYGLEAISRGASSCLFVERDRAALAALGANLAAVCRSAGQPDTAGRIAPADATRWAPPPGEAYDLILADPPYDLAASSAPALLERFAPWLAPEGHLVFEVPGEQDLPPPPSLILVRQLGDRPRQPSARIFRRT